MYEDFTEISCCGHYNVEWTGKLRSLKFQNPRDWEWFQICSVFLYSLYSVYSRSSTGCLKKNCKPIIFIIAIGIIDTSVSACATNYAPDVLLCFWEFPPICCAFQRMQFFYCV